jgi:dipeptidyl aminopeptidase/acylaminoacyl peptidase
VFLCLSLTGAGCSYVPWEPAPAPVMPVPPPPEDSILNVDEGNEFFGDDDDDDEPGSASGLIPREVLFGNPTKAAPRLSPDGKRLAFLAPSGGVLNVWVGPTGDVSKAKAITKSKKRPIRRFFWAYDNQHLVYLQDKGGDENWRAYSVDVATGKEIDLTPLEGVRTNIQELSHKKPHTILVGLNDRDKRYHDIYSVDLRTGKRTLVQKNDGEYGGFETDEDFAVRYATKPTPDGGEQIYINKGDTFSPFIRINSDDALTTHIVGFDKSGQKLFMVDSRGRDTAALVAMAARGGNKAVIAKDEQADIVDVLRHPTLKTVQAVVSNYERKKWQFFDPKVKADFATLAKVTRGDIVFTSRTLDDRKWTVAFVTDDGPVRYYLYDRKWTVAFVTDDGPVRYYLYDRATKKAKFLFTNRPELEDLKLAKMRPVVIEARDGLKMVSYLTLPAAISGARPPHPLPMVLFVHGGPWSRDSWGYNPYHQWLANRGYAVLSVNYRGSTGFGKRHINLSNHEWSGKMHDDLIDAVKWAVREGVAPKDKIAIMGGSYGGYATLVGLTFTPTTFACGVDIVGPSNLVTLLESIPPYWAPYLALFKKRVGDHKTALGKKQLMNRSPLSRADKIVRPLLIGQGANDPRVKQAESDQIVQAMEKKKIPVTYVLFPDEGHGFAKPENRLAFNAVAEAFLGRCLGGQSQPPGDDFEGSSIEVPAGKKLVPGLGGALD